MTTLREHARRGFVWPFPSDSIESYGYGGQTYFGTASLGASTPSQEPPPAGFAQLVDGPFRSNAVVFACEQKRMSIFSEARFLYRNFSKGRPGRVWSDTSLDILERPWPRGTTGDLLARMIQHADLGGNSYVARTMEDPDRLHMMRPDWVTIVMGDSSGRLVESAQQLDAEIIGFIYAPQDGLTEPEVLTAEEVCHFAPIPDPLARFRGMSWLTPVIREVQADQAATMHKLGFFENGATPQLVVTFDATVTEEQFKAFVQKMDQTHSGWRNAYKTLYLGGGADVTVAGKDMQQLDFKVTQGAGETRIAAAAGLHPVIVPLSEGLQGSSLNAGNYAAARRSTADTTFRPLWRNVSGSLAAIVPPPSGSELWWDEFGVAFLREDAKDRADILNRDMLTVESGVRGGFEPESVKLAVAAGDLTLMKHTGLFSVQLQPPGTTAPPATETQSAAEPSPNGTAVTASGNGRN